MKKGFCIAVVMLLGILTVIATTPASEATPAVSESDSVAPPDDQISAILTGKICRSRLGAQFTFTESGHYAYDGLWQSTGHYAVHNGAITVLLDNGLERDFVITKRHGVLYMEDTAIVCS